MDNVGGRHQPEAVPLAEPDRLVGAGLGAGRDRPLGVCDGQEASEKHGRRSRAHETPSEKRACRIGVTSPASSPSRSDEVQGIEIAKNERRPHFVG